MAGLGKLLVIAGILIIVAGLILWLGGERLTWFGHLPGDIKIERKNFSFYFPLTSMILVSVVLSMVVWIVRKYL